MLKIDHGWSRNMVVRIAHIRGSYFGGSALVAYCWVEPVLADEIRNLFIFSNLLVVNSGTTQCLLSPILALCIYTALSVLCVVIVP